MEGGCFTFVLSSFHVGTIGVMEIYEMSFVTPPYFFLTMIYRQKGGKASSSALLKTKTLFEVRGILFLIFYFFSFSPDCKRTAANRGKRELQVGAKRNEARKIVCSFA